MLKQDKINTMQNPKEEIFSWLRSSFSSVIIHVIGFILIASLSNLTMQRELINPVYYTVEFNEIINTESIVAEDLPDEMKKELPEPEANNTSNQLTFNDIKTDTTKLDQLYKENTRNVSIKYPRGWSFVDQNVKNKLDGVTFWSSEGLYNPPPYIHLETKEKYYFNEQKYKYQIEFDDCIAYYNDPEVIEDYYIQNVYLRTETEEDFSIKLMIAGEEAFKSFQPQFFGMIKTFNFGSSIF